MEDGWSVETAQSNVEIIVDIKERGKCQLSPEMREKELREAIMQ